VGSVAKSRDRNKLVHEIFEGTGRQLTRSSSDPWEKKNISDPQSPYISRIWMRKRGRSIEGWSGGIEWEAIETIPACGDKEKRPPGTGRTWDVCKLRRRPVAGERFKGIRQCSPFISQGEEGRRNRSWITGEPPALFRAEKGEREKNPPSRMVIMRDGKGPRRGAGAHLRMLFQYCRKVRTGSKPPERVVPGKTGGRWSGPRFLFSHPETWRGIRACRSYVPAFSPHHWEEKKQDNASARQIREKKDSATNWSHNVEKKEGRRVSLSLSHQHGLQEREASGSRHHVFSL